MRCSLQQGLQSGPPSGLSPMPNGPVPVPIANLGGAASAAGGRFANRRGRGVATDNQIRTGDGDGAPAAAHAAAGTPVASHPKSKRRSPAPRHKLLLP